MSRPLIALLSCLSSAPTAPAEEPVPIASRPIEIRGIYGGVPRQIFERGETLDDYGINAVWIGSGALRDEDIALLKAEGASVFAEFNSMHVASFVEQHPDAAPVGPDGEPSPPPDGWQGVCPSHPGYRRSRMDEFRRVLETFEVDGIWLDYHHAQANWEREEPILPDTCFCDRCLDLFRDQTGVGLPEAPTAENSARLLGPLRDEWVRWRCDLFTDWVRQFGRIRDEVRPDALLGTFHCPWSEDDFDGALRRTLAIDLHAQAPLFDVLSPMPYHARFGHADDPGWISRQLSWLGGHLGVEGEGGGRPRVWPIVQLSDWGEAVPVDQVGEVLDHGTRGPSTGVTVFAWGGLASDWDKVGRLGAFYRDVGGSGDPAP
ncbi:alpha-amylase family protein [Tautonia plasticadhaerens]|uniref:Glycosyl hydrolase-like 10 domain-containing protein n=1 Tax=Tautonia plasticadhaerens TaxID=2527974 RepID=A0A518H7K4_9BACT|nr:hypothetical protein [Tautonia plasticadhaerens]QDV36823.1 hypothetical protein ElP_47520 [Tautonia plasticadhaerens]